MFRSVLINVLYKPNSQMPHALEFLAGGSIITPGAYFAVQHFVGYDPEGYSFWACDFKYNDENTVTLHGCARISFIRPPSMWRKI